MSSKNNKDRAPYVLMHQGWSKANQRRVMLMAQPLTLLMSRPQITCDIADVDTADPMLTALMATPPSQLLTAELNSTWAITDGYTADQLRSLMSTQPIEVCQC
jgi:hypothetical protein